MKRVFSLSAGGMKISRIRRVTLVGIFVNIFLALLKIILGIFANSQALVADGFHSLGDLFTDFAVIFGVKYWSMPADENHPYGHGKMETFTTLFIGLVLIMISFFIAYNAAVTIAAFRRKPGLAAFLAAAVSVVVKEFLYRWTLKKNSVLKSPALAANAWHHRSDALSSLPVAAAILAASINPAWQILDNLGAFAVSIFIFYSALKIIKPNLLEFTDASASKEERERISEILESTEGVKSIHKLRTRKVSNGIFLDVHIQVNPEISVRQGHDISNRAKASLFEKGGNILDVIIHIEPYE